MGVDSPASGTGILSATLRDFFAHYYARQPVTATFTGVHQHDAYLPDWSRGARETERAELLHLRERLRLDHPLPAGGAGALANDPSGLDAELARANIDVRIAELDSAFFHDRNPALWTGEAIFGAVSLMIRPFAPAAERLPALIARLQAIPAFLAQMRSTIDEPIPAAWNDRAQRECVAAQRLFSDGLQSWLTHHNVSAPSSLHQAAQVAVAAFVTTAQWLEERPAADIAAYGCGAGLLQTLLQRGHYSDVDARVLLAQAEAELPSASAAVSESLRPYDDSWAQAQAAMRADAPRVEDYYATFGTRWTAIRNAAVAQDIVTWPDWPIRYVPIPEWAQASQPSLYWLFYRSPAPFDPYDVYDYVVTPVEPHMSPEVVGARLAAWNNSVITLNHVVHHGGLGHHVQNWHARHCSTSQVGAIAAVDAASRIGMFLGGSMAEGWACYATALADELQLLTPLEQLSERHTRVRLLARAIVDLRLHLGDWTFPECVAFYERYVGMTAEVARAEACKNSMFPATALMYWLGSTGIVQLRSRIERALGTRFSRRAFHDAVLSRGAIPVPLVAQLIEHELQGAIAAPSSQSSSSAVP